MHTHTHKMKIELVDVITYSVFIVDSSMQVIIQVCLFNGRSLFIDGYDECHSLKKDKKRIPITNQYHQ
jgi:hypothetical protein